MRAGSGALETWADGARYAFSFLHGFTRERSTRCSRWPNRPRTEVGGDRRSEKRRGQTKALNSRIDGLLATVSSAVVPVESPGCQRHPQLAWTSTNSRAEPLFGWPLPPPTSDDRSFIYRSSLVPPGGVPS